MIHNGLELLGGDAPQSIRQQYPVGAPAKERLMLSSGATVADSGAPVADSGATVADSGATVADRRATVPDRGARVA
ncbi:MAG: hypothetical protein AB4352_06480 [Hormoscilla sp.]